jgi:hypothetical protein
VETEAFAKQNHREEIDCRRSKRRRGELAIRCGHQVRRAFALMAATVSPRTGAIRGELEQAEEKTSEK